MFMRGPGGEFFTQHPTTGQMAPVSECLQANCGRDFGKYVRYHQGKFPYSSYSPSCAEHDDLMKGREFRILIPSSSTCTATGESAAATATPKKKNYWITGTIVKWEEWNNGPGDSRLKYSLFASLQLNNDKLDDDTKKMIIGSCNDEDGSLIAKLFVHNMNVHGGGIVHFGSNNEAGNTDLLSLEWVDPIPPDEDAYWFNTSSTHQRWEAMGRPIDSEMLATMRTEYMKKYPRPPSDAQPIPKKLLDSFLEKMNLHDLYEFRMLCLATPFSVFRNIASWILSTVLGPVSEYDRQDAFVIVQTIIEIAGILRDDQEWCVQCKKVDPLQNLGDHVLSVPDLYSKEYYMLVVQAGEWYESNGEYRAAVWAYQQNVDFLSDPECQFSDQIPNDTKIPGLTNKMSNKVYLLSYIGLAKKRMGDFAGAFKYYQEGIGMSSHKANPIFRNTKTFKIDATDWVGSTGKLTQWRTAEDGSDSDDAQDDNVKKCNVCQREANLQLCSKCFSVSYCGRDCQKKDWKNHKLICFGVKK